MNRIAKLILISAMMLALSNTALAQSSTNMPMSAELFQSLGGTAGISKTIDDFLVIWQADPRISRRLNDADLDRLGALLKEQISSLTGGPGAYSGKDMTQAHAEMGIRNVEFNALAEDLQLAMEKNDIASSAQNKLLAKLAPMQKQIVSK